MAEAWRNTVPSIGRTMLNFQHRVQRGITDFVTPLPFRHQLGGIGRSSVLHDVSAIVESIEKAVM